VVKAEAVQQEILLGHSEQGVVVDDDAQPAAAAAAQLEGVQSSLLLLGLEKVVLQLPLSG